MFPLGNVVLPGEAVPLHVFEPRYRRLVLDCLAMESGDAVFGIALIEHGQEVGGGDQRSSVATLARIAQVAPLPDRRFALIVHGVGRLSALEWLSDDPYPIADVEPWPDPSPDDLVAVVARLEELSQRVDSVRALNHRAATGQVETPVPLELGDDPIRAAYQLAAAAPLGAADRYHVLQAPSIPTRLDILDKALDDVEAALRFRLT